MISKRRWLTTLVATGAALGLSGGIAYAATAPAAASTVHTVSAVHGNSAAPSATHPASEPAGESAGESNAEHSGESTHSDGPGGHADPAGNVDHQFNGQE